MLSRNRPSKLVLQKKYLRRACFFYSFMSSWFYVLLSSTLSSKFYSLLFSQTMIYDWLPLYLIETYSHALLKQFTFSLLIPRLPPSPPCEIHFTIHTRVDPLLGRCLLVQIHIPLHIFHHFFHLSIFCIVTVSISWSISFQIHLHRISLFE